MGVVPVNSNVTVTTAGTSVRAVSAPTYADAIYFEALGGNSSYIYIGLSDVSSTKYIARLAAGQGISLSANTQGRVGTASGGAQLQVNSYYVDAGANSQSVMLTYFPRVGSA